MSELAVMAGASVEGRMMSVTGRLRNSLSRTVSTSAGDAVGCQWFDPVSGRFLREGLWHPLKQATDVGGSTPVDVSVVAPSEDGTYHLVVGLVGPEGWQYDRGGAFLRCEVRVEQGKCFVGATESTTWRQVRNQGRFGRLIAGFVRPFRTLWQHRRLIATTSKRDLQARYRGSIGEAFWALLNPLLLMATYVFVFGFVLKARFPGEASSTGYLLSFLAGLIPWLGLNEAAARAPMSLVDNRNIVKKLVFPLEILPVSPLVAGLVNQAIALGLLLAAYLLFRGAPPSSWLCLLPLLWIQVTFSLGLGWLLSATGVFLRDLGQVIGFLLTLVFFLSPVCYPESALPPEIRPWLALSPVYFLVTNYRRVLMEGQWLDPVPTVGFALAGMLVFFIGWAWFRRLRPQFPDAL
jgi:lipopolysaccharide transport system permease protein